MVARKQSFVVLASMLVSLLLLGGVHPAFSKEEKTVSQSQVGQVNLNKASLEELEKVHGIGPVIAQRILDYRTSNGSFKSLEELSQVNGIGRVKYERMKEHLTL